MSGKVGAGTLTGHGLVHVYTGDGKGKTTAALGLAMRTIGNGMRVLIIQFMKTPDFYSECRAAESIEGLDIVSTAPSCLVFAESAGPEDIEAAREGVRIAREAIASGRYQLVILDEVNVAVKWGLVDPEEIVRIVSSRPVGVEIVLTGRYAPKEFIEKADHVTEARCVKHPYEKGILSRAGIDR